MKKNIGKGNGFGFGDALFAVKNVMADYDNLD
jgi:hypothetical protein